ncbi:MAG: PP2C family protein-serine/threonine phosphatase [Phycisphaerales bacterium]|jgi:sigma-B regulation protein RsbU (phosphoserine phosphatase)|nr:PP2C family protein-serine/threonine phosphatase [Phycisphaerales bacterium]
MGGSGEALREVIVASSPDRRERAEILARAIEARWPRRDKPIFRHVASVDLLTEDVEVGVTLPGGGGPVVLVLDEDTPQVAVSQMLDVLAQKLAPVLVLALEGAARFLRLERDGVIVERDSSDPGMLAGMLLALRERQRSVVEVARDLVIAETTSGGMKGEVDRMHEELHLAASVQQEFLPKTLDATPGLDVGVLFRPANYVSGDIYDVVRLDERRVGFLIADAVGHGVPAALLTMVISRSLPKGGGVAGAVLEPEEAMSRLNLELCRRQAQSFRFATAIYGIIDVVTGEAHLCGAGHPHPLVISSRGVTPVLAEGPLLGVFEDATYERMTITLREGETLVLYSDGFEVAFPPEGAEGDALRLPTRAYIDEFTRVARSAGELRESMARLEARIDQQAGSLHQADDVTALAIRLHRGESERAAA